MRDLTEEELKLAPDWATHYFKDDHGDILFESTSGYQWASGLKLKDRIIVRGYSVKLSKPIKPFDITKHEFSDTVGFVECDGSELTLNCTGCNYVELYKDDAIAIAKALGVTGEDLK